MSASPAPALLAIDWGTSSFRAYLLDARGDVLGRREAPLGILAVEDGAFAEALRSVTGDWIAPGGPPVLMSGMIGSRQGWREAPYVGTPAGAAELARNLAEVEIAPGCRGGIVAGVITRAGTGVHDVMRGEETQIVGALDTLGDGRHTICLPGTHSKWVTVESGRIVAFRTHMTGEAFAILRSHSILGRTMSAAPEFDADAFERGVRRAGDPGGLLHHLFGVRAEFLAGELSGDASADYLSGILIGAELRAEHPDNTVNLLGSRALAERYRIACAALGVTARLLDPDTVILGLQRIARARGLLPEGSRT